MKIITNRKEWDSIFKDGFSAFEDVYFQYDYFELYRKHFHVDFEGVFWENENIKVFWSHLIRSLGKYPIFQAFELAYDLTTAYGYGGPLVVLKNADEMSISSSLKSFFDEYSIYCKSKHYVSEFIRFHPLSLNWRYCDDLISLKYTNDIVIVDLAQNLDTLWQNVKKGHKYNIKKTLKEGCTTRIINSPTKEDIERFVKIYYKTMDKNKATAKYYFSQEFIEDHFKLLNALIIEIVYKEKVVNSSIFLYKGNYIHYHLSGSDNEVKSIYPATLAIWTMIEYSKKQGFKYLQLGGGRGINDGLYEFKNGFSNFIRPFHFGKIIFDNNLYNELTKLNLASSENPEFFPLYRVKLDDNIV